MRRLIQGVMLLLCLLPVSVLAAPPVLNRAPVMQPVQPSAQETQQQNFSVAKGAPFKLRIGVTTPGPIYIDLSWRGVPLEVKLQSEVTQQLLAAQTGAAPALRLTYMVTAADVQRGYFSVATVYVPVGYKLEESKAAIAQGTIRAVYPKPDQRLLAAAPPPPAQQQAVPQIKGAQTVAERMQHVPLRYALPRLQVPSETKLLSRTSVNLNQKMLVERRTAIPFKPFTMEEVFDPQTGKPLFSHNIDERTGELILPNTARRSGEKLNVERVKDVQALQQKGLNSVVLKQGGAVRFGKLTAGPLGVKSRISIPRREGMVVETSVEDYLRELNDFEMHLNAVGQTLRDPQTGKIKTTPTVAVLAKLQHNEQLLQKQNLDTKRLFVPGTVYRPWTPAIIKSFEAKSLAVAPKELLVPGGLLAAKKIALAPKAAVITAVAGKDVRPLGPGQAAARPDDTCLIVASPAGGPKGASFDLQVDKYLQNSCNVEFVYANGARYSANPQFSGGNTVKVQIPIVAEGAVTLRVWPNNSQVARFVQPAPNSPHARQFYIGSECSLEHSSADKSLAGMELTLNGGRLSGCKVDFTAANGMTLPATIVQVSDGSLKVKIPNLPDGQAVISAKTAAGVKGSHTLPFTVMKNIYAQAGTGGQGAAAAQGPPPDYFSRDLQPFDRSLNWKQDYGDPASFAVGLSTDFSIYTKGAAEDNLVKFKGYGGANGTLFNHGVEIIGARGDVSIPTGNTKNDNDLRANFRITAAGFDLYKWGKQKNQQNGAEKAECSPEDKDSSGKCCDKKDSSGKCSDDGFVMQVRFEYKKHYEFAKVDYSTETNFTLGPVPMVARFGFRGEAGADLHAVVTPLQVIGQVTPYVNTSVYGECGVNLWFAEGGVGVNMTLLNLKVDAAGQAYINFGTMKFDVDAYVYLKYDALSGYVYAYLNAFGGHWKWDIANWNGFRGDVYILPVQKLSFPLIPGA